MNIPNKVKIGGHNYAIKFKNLDRDEQASNCGYCKPSLNEIVINTEITGQQQASTLLHEIIEVINWLNQLELEHHKIQSIESTLYQVLRDNNLRF